MKQVSSSDFSYSLKKGLLVNEEGRLLEVRVDKDTLKSESSVSSRIEEWVDEDFSLLFRAVKVHQK